MHAVRWGVIGASGFAQRRTIPEGIVAAANSELAAVCARNEERIRAVGERFGVPWFTDVEAMLTGSELDAVYIASPPAAHLAHARACAERGLHVLCEKPLAHTVEDAEAIVGACHAAGVRCGTAFMLPFHSLAVKCKEIVASDEIGTVVSARIQFGFDYPPQDGAFRQAYAESRGGAFMDVGNHAADLMERLIGSRARAALALAGNRAHAYDGVEDTCVALLQFDSGAIGIVDAYFCTPAAPNVVEINGSRGSISIEGMMGQGTGGLLRVQGESPREIESDGRNMYHGEISAFADAVLRGVEPPITGEDGLHSQRLVAAVYESASTGRLTGFD